MRRIAVALLSAAVVVVNLWATGVAPTTPQQQPPPGQGRGEGRGRGGGLSFPSAIPFEDRTGFVQIFDGVSLKNWDGDPTFWRVENGALVGESTEANPVKENTFLIYRGGEPADFELKLEFRINRSNSGVQYRSVHVPQGSKDGDRVVAGKWVLKGYQADIDFDNRFTGMLYEERGRQIVALRGQVGLLAEPLRGAIGALESADTLKAFIKVNDWNQFHVVARGGTLVHILNGHVTALLVDDEAKSRTLKGLIGLQIHVGPPMKVEFRNVYLKVV
jgi:hypothetical protein